jgi:hypothetical protein
VTVHVVPDTVVTAMISLVFPVAVSATWNWVGGVPPEFAPGNDAEDVTVHDSTVPEDGAVVPPETTVVSGWLANVSIAVTHASGGG